MRFVWHPLDADAEVAPVDRPDQASDRAHRIGQSRPVTIYRLVARDTIEDRILGLHHRKRELATGILEGSDLAGRMSEAELLELIRGPQR